MLESFISILSGAVMPVLLLGTGLVFSFRLRFFWIAHPIRCAKLLLSGTSGDGQTPLRAMTVALAGTLGVGNIAGVATAISAGGAGAVFWMWVSAILAMGVKYAEVTLAVAHRRTEYAPDAAGDADVADADVSKNTASGDAYCVSPGVKVCTAGTERTGIAAEHGFPYSTVNAVPHAVVDRRTEYAPGATGAADDAGVSEGNGSKHAGKAAETGNAANSSASHDAGNVASRPAAHGAGICAKSVSSGTKKTRYGGAMYYIRDIISPAFGGLFALLCVANALITGNILQVNAAAAVCPTQIPPAAVGIVMAILCAAVTVGSAKRISDVTVRLVPILSAFYILLSLGIIAAHIGEIPAVFASIFRSAFGIRPAVGGAAGASVAAAIRYGVTRGILSNEAGSGTSPTAHASADTDDPHRQGVFGIFEVFADTVVICTLTALVILLLPDFRGEDGVRLAALAYRTFAGRYAGFAIRASVVLFAFATVICQAYYGTVAVGYFTRSPLAKRAWLAAYSLTCVVGAVIDPTVMWSCADLCISLMTAINTSVLLFAIAANRHYWSPRLRRERCSRRSSRG